MCVAHILDYSAVVWGHKYYSQIESVQNQAMKFCLRVHKFATTDAVHGDLKWVNSYNRRKLKLLKYWNRLCETDESRLLYKVFSWDYRKRAQYSWCSEVQIPRHFSFRFIFHKQNKHWLKSI